MICNECNTPCEPYERDGQTFWRCPQCDSEDEFEMAYPDEDPDDYEWDDPFGPD